MAPAKPHLANQRDEAPTDVDDGDEWIEVIAEGDYIAVRAEGVEWTDVVVRGGRWSGATFANFRATDVRFENCDLAGFVFQEDVSLRRVEFVGCRMTGAVLAGAHLRDVTFSSCALDEANLRMIDAQDVAFEDCNLVEADLHKTKLAKVTVVRCDLRGIELSKTTMSEVDLRTSRLEDIKGADALRGATIDSVQMLALARSFATTMGLTIVDYPDTP